MNRTRNLVLALALLAPLAAPAGALAQAFTRITDPVNPIVTATSQSGGGCWVDLVGDGYLDLFVANGNLANQPNALYRNLRPGGFVRVVSGPVVTDGGSSIGGTFGDFDGDGILDLFVTNRNNFGNFLYRGLGDTLFARVTSGAPATDVANSNSTSWVDLDVDGNLDLYVVNFQGNDFLYRNDGGPGYTFTRVDTTAATPGAEFSIPGAWGDVNGDGLPDLFIGNAGTQSDYLYINHGGLFFTRTVIADGVASLGASFGDYDNDGDLDLFVAHYLGAKSTLYQNGGPPAYALSPVATGIVSNEAGSWVGSAWGDYDNDGALDLFVARDGGASSLYHNDGPPLYGFTKSAAAPIATDTGNAFGAVWGDYDRDGQLDLFVANESGGGNRLYHNGGTANHWLTVRCIGTASNRSGIGARVRLLATIAGSPRWQMREVTGQTGYNSQNLDQHFGLGDAALADSLVVDWPSGRRDTYALVPVDTLLQVVEGAGTVAVAPGDPARKDGPRLDSPAPNPCRGESWVRFLLMREADTSVDVFDVRGRHITNAARGRMAAGPHVVRLAIPAGSPAGIYFCRLTTSRVALTARLAYSPGK
ncbi:MAG: CRTAC1 family protein [Candidatus Eisenbacteria bacterium]